MNGLTALPDAVMRDVKRSGRWLQAWVERRVSRLRFSELESNREAYATAVLIRPGFLQVLPLVDVIPHWFGDSAGEVMITNS
jgi:hypothetical protein